LATLTTRQAHRAAQHALPRQEQVKGAGDEDEEEAPQKQMTFSYWAIDYPRAFDMIQYRLYIMRKLLKVIGVSQCWNRLQSAMLE
jgi:hypothetical protein